MLPTEIPSHIIIWTKLTNTSANRKTTRKTSIRIIAVITINKCLYISATKPIIEVLLGYLGHTNFDMLDSDDNLTKTLERDLEHIQFDTAHQGTN